MEKIIIFGIGKYGKACVDECLACGIGKEKIKIVDSNNKVWGKRYQNIIIDEPKQSILEKCDLVIIAVSDKYKQEILELLRNIYNIPDEKIMFYIQMIMLPKDKLFNIDNAMLVNVDGNIFGTGQYYNMWNELYKIALKGMSIGGGG